MPSDSALSDKNRSVIYTQTRHKARSSPAVGLPRALWKHFASASFSAPVADFREYVEVAGHDDSESDYYSTSIISKNISRVCSSSSFLVSSWKPFLR